MKLKTRLKVLATGSLDSAFKMKFCLLFGLFTWASSASCCRVQTEQLISSPSFWVTPAEAPVNSDFRLIYLLWVLAPTNRSRIWVGWGNCTRPPGGICRWFRCLKNCSFILFLFSHFSHPGSFLPVTGNCCRWPVGCLVLMIKAVDPVFTAGNRNPSSLSWCSAVYWH